MKGLNVKLFILAIALAATFITGTHFAFTEIKLEIFALFLALTSCVYGGAVLTPAGAKYATIELPFVIIVFVSAVAGLAVSPVFIAIGYFIHGCWDMLHHTKKVNTPMVKWFPPTCAIFDAVVGVFVLYWWWATL